LNPRSKASCGFPRVPLPVATVTAVEAETSSPCRNPKPRWIMTSMRRRTALGLGLTILFVMPAVVRADPPPETTASQASGPVTAPPDTSGRVVTVVVPPAPKPAKKPRAKAAAPRTAAPARTVARPKVVAPPPPVVPRQVVTPVTHRTQRAHVRRTLAPTARGGASKRVAVPPQARGGASAALVEPSLNVTPQDAPPVAAPPVANPAAVAAKPGNARNWGLWLLAAVGALEALVLIRFAYRRWSSRRSRLRAARNLADASAVRAPEKTTYYGRRQAAKRGRQ
jgi:hypothetical protein